MLRNVPVKRRVREVGEIASTRLTFYLTCPDAAHAERLEPHAEAPDAGEELDESRRLRSRGPLMRIMTHHRVRVITVVCATKDIEI